MINATPADTGRAHSNWTAELDQASAALFPAYVPGEKGSTAEANAVTDQFDITANREIHVANSLPYIGTLNDGHSNQAPAGFVKEAIIEGLATVRGAKIL